MAEEGELTPEELLEHIRQLKVSDLLLSILPTVAQLGYAKLEPDGRDLEQARLAIDSLRALAAVLAGSVPEEVVQRLRAGDREPAARLREGGRRKAGEELRAGPDDGRDWKRGHEAGPRARSSPSCCRSSRCSRAEPRSGRARSGAVDVDRRAVARRVGGREELVVLALPRVGELEVRSCSRAGRGRSATAARDPAPGPCCTRIGGIFGGRAAGHEPGAAALRWIPSSTAVILSDDVRDGSAKRAVPGNEERREPTVQRSTGRWTAAGLDVQPLGRVVAPDRVPNSPEDLSQSDRLHVGRVRLRRHAGHVLDHDHASGSALLDVNLDRQQRRALVNDAGRQSRTACECPARSPARGSGSFAGPEATLCPAPGSTFFTGAAIAKT